MLSQTREKEGIFNFEAFYTSFVKQYERDIDQILLDYGYIFKSGRKIKEDIYYAAIFDLNKIAFRTLLYEFYMYKQNQKIGSDEEDFYYRNFNKYCGTPQFIEKIESEYGYLLKLLHQRMDNNLRNIRTLLEHFIEDITDIQFTLQLKVHFISSISFGLGDSHNGGKNVSFIETNVGRLVYKPHHLNNDLLFNGLINFVSKENNIPMETVKTVSKENRGWQEYIEPKSFQSVKEAETYYRNLGVHLAVFYILKTDDIHYENIIMHRDMPYILDLETIIANKKDEQSASDDTLFTLFCNEINDSVMGSLILPANYKFSPFDIDLSAISNETEVSEHWKSFIIENPKTDDIRLVRKPSYVEKNHVVAKINEEVIHPYDYIDKLKEGFKVTYQFIMKKQQYFLSYIKNYRTRKISTRQVLRPTSLYAKVLDAITHPTYMHNEERIQNIFRKLYPNKGITEAEESRINCEIQALWQHDVPYFTQHINSYNLMANENKEIKGYFKNTPISIVEKRINNLCEDDLKRQLAYIDLSMKTLPREATNKRHFVSHHTKFNCAEYVRRSLNDELKLAIHDDNTVTWMCHEVDEKNKIKLSPLSYSLYDSLGLLINLLSFYKVTKEDIYLEYAKKGLYGVLSVYPYEELIKANTISVFNGAGGYLYVLEQFYSIEQDDYYMELMNKITNHMMKNNSEIKEMDYTSGTSGIIFLFYRLYQQHHDNLFQKAAIYFGEQLMESYQRRNLTLNGLAHGYAGISMAFSALYSLTSEKKYLDLLKDAIDNENSHFNLEQGNWSDLRDGHKTKDPLFWCHGAPGIGLARLNVLQIIKDIDPSLEETIKRDLNYAVKKIVKDGFRGELDDSLCHGKSGNLDILIEINQYLKDEQIALFTQEQVEELKLRVQDGNYRSGAASKLPINNFMLGVYGLDYIFMRIEHPQLPSILNLSF
ncbi:type 2 lanthipeptide synthetase LanM [Priestia endophytica]|uniref:type 2 lanthipeptide synthetase LanM n=1 Tax=Priestia endophytica TaxID=135735 RepID=UPI003D2B1DB6